jgi:tRNA 2-selenouridine synthase
MKEFASLAIKMAPGSEALLHCWRGGMRSNSMAWLLNTVGIKAYTLDGGYKSYRRFVHQYFEQPLNMVVIGGMTGSGKTDVLEALELKGQQVINLERIAGHKGSVFGGIGMPRQPTTEQFENDLFARIRLLERDKPIYIEDESIAIGRVFIPEPFYRQMSPARCINLIVPSGRRIAYLVENYTTDDKELLVSGVKHIERRLGPENAAKVIGLILNGEMAPAVEMVLKYYDKVYERSMGLQKRKETMATKEPVPPTLKPTP